MTLSRPSVTLHLAQTIDGRIAGRGARAEHSTREGLLWAAPEGRRHQPRRDVGAKPS